jgi:hypothetical protein
MRGLLENGMHRRLLMVASIAALVAASGVGARARATTPRKFYVSVVDSKTNDPVKDLTAADFEVKEGGKTQEISVAPASSPLRVTLIDADGGTGVYQNAVIGVINGLGRLGEYRLVGVAEQPLQLTDYTSDMQVLSAAVPKLARRTASRTPGQVMEAIFEATKTIAADGKRPVIIVFRVGGEAGTSIQATTVRDALRKTGAVLYVVSPVGGGGMGASGMGMQTNAKDADESESMSNAAELGRVLDDGSKESGGHHDMAAPSALGKVVDQLVNELKSQYEVSYTLADGVKPSDRLQVSSKRKNVKVYAPSKIAN